MEQAPLYISGLSSTRMVMETSHLDQLSGGCGKKFGDQDRVAQVPRRVFTLELALGPRIRNGIYFKSCRSV
jgi:hypothetical protein